MAEGMKYNFAAEDIVPKAVFTPPYAPLAFARPQACQLFDWMPSGAPVWVFREDGNKLPKSIKQLVVSLR